MFRKYLQIWLEMTIFANIILRVMELSQELKKEWYDLHVKLVEEVISFCNKHNVKDAWEFSLYADAINLSMKENKWMPCTDSSFRLLNKNNEEILTSI